MLHRLVPSVLAALPTCLAAQTAEFDVVGALGRGKVAAEHYSAKLAFDYTSSLITVPVQLGERECHMLLDTGAPMAVTPELAKQLGLATVGRCMMGDSTGHARETEFVALGPLDLGGVRYTDLVAVVVDLRAMPTLRERGIDGLVGTNLLRLGALGIDYVARTIEVTDDTTRLVPKDGIVVPFTTSPQGGPYLTFALAGKSLPGALLDTGCNGDLALPEDAVGERPPARRIDVLGSTAAGAFGKSREGSRMVWLTGLSLGGNALPDSVVESHAEGKPRLGNRFFERTRLVFDWRTSRLWIEAPAKLGRAQLRTHGMALKHENDTALVATVLSGSSAERAKLAPGQRVLAVGDIDLRAGGLAEFVRAVTALRDDAGKDVTVTIERDGKAVELKLALELLLPR